MVLWWVVLAAGVAGAAACPSHCSCFTDPDGYRSANCSTLALGSVQPSSLDLLAFQVAERGYPTRLAPRAFQAFRKLKFLWMVNCSVLNLPNDVFQGLDYVIKIDLSYNKIRHLNGGVFKSLGSLHTLMLRGNPLLITPWDVIVSDSLQELDLGHCGLRTIPQGTFISVPRLSRLYLDGNEIHTFTFNMIPAGLRYLNLARNRIVNVPTDVLTAMSYLRKLDLSKNPIKCNCNLLIMQDWFSGQGIIFENGVTCLEPSQYAGQQLSKINENELCTFEEVKRQRRINDIESYRVSKVHRTHNMIHDPDLQADQPNGELYSEFDDDRTAVPRELSKKPYLLPSDLSDENNKLADSKHELVSTETDIESPPTSDVKLEMNEDQERTSHNFLLNITDHDHYKSPSATSTELSVKNEEAFLIRTSTSEHETTEDTFDKSESTSLSIDVQSRKNSGISTIGPDIEMADEGYSPLYNNNTSANKLSVQYFLSTSESTPEREMADEAYSSVNTLTSLESQSSQHAELADEGYSPAFNITSQDEGETGSGYGSSEYHDLFSTNAFSSSESANTTSPETYTWPSSRHDSIDYSYDTQHDYSAEAVPTTETMNTTETDEGSGFAESDSYTSSSLPPYMEEGNETTTTDFLTIENSIDLLSSTSDYYSSSPSYASSSEGTAVSESNITETKQTDEGTSEYPELSSTSDSSISSSEMPFTSDISSSSTESSTSPEPPTSIASSEAPVSSSTEESSPIIPHIETDSTSPPTVEDTVQEDHLSSTVETSTADFELIKKKDYETKGQIVEDSTHEGGAKEVEESPRQSAQSTLSYVIAGLLVALIVLVITTIICRKVSKMGPCTSKKKVRLPQDTEANLGTEMQDMLLPKPPENGVKIIPQNGTPNGKEAKEEEIPVLQKDWDEKPEPIETVTARMSILAGPQTPVFIHKTLA